MSFSWLDAVLVVFVIAHLAMGVSQGLLAGALGLLGFGATLWALLAGAPRIGALVGARAPWPSAVSVIVAAAGLVLAVRLAVVWIGNRLGPRLAGAPRPLRRANHVLGLLPGAGWGAMGAVLIAWLVSAFMNGLPPHSTLSRWALERSKAPLARVAEAVPASLPTLALFPGGWELLPGAAAEPASLAPSRLERQMLGLVNQERRKAHLKPLAWDGALAALGRAHSQDMLKRSYFAHEDPQGHSVAYRAARAGVRYLLIGENLAFAPNLAIAHRGLMQSPGHRANILRPGFGRLGIGIVRVPPGASYTPRHQGKSPPLPLRGVGGYLLVTQVFRN